MFDRVHGEVLSLFRIVTGLLFVCHGAATLFGVLGGAFGTGHATTAGTWPGWYAALIQLAAGTLVLIGLVTRPAALLASGSMAYAYFTVHQERGLWPIQNGGELPVMFCWSFLLIAIFGPGAWSVGALIRKSRGVSGAELAEA
ncbi:DoxX family protein [Rugosimonospora africana]|uniref:Integral membrane protein n=1 Tax=Rugosimonospora africana TaxID=556532 RepID=A0A8J3VQD2_9ACTN|nr:DoxX family protein [Rugosimonospora africana]GIH15024.1 integral membrane protein [Rugosimonospora africana]